MRRLRILITDGDPVLRTAISNNLRSADNEIFQAADEDEAIQVIEKESPDLIITDIMLPNVDICRRIREISHANIIVISTLVDNEIYKIKCLNAGVDGFLPKPFSMQDLMACTEPILKRNAEEISKGEPTKTLLVSGELKIEFAARRVTISNRDVKLSPTEFDILKELALNAGKVLTHNLLISRIWGSEYCHEREYLRIFVNRLRRKLELTPGKPKMIVTIPWIGYKLNLPESRMN